MKFNVTGQAVVYRHEPRNGGKPNYSVQFAKKVKGTDGTETWQNAWMYCNFRKGVDVANKTKINITSGWLDFYTSKVTVVAGDGMKEVAWDRYGVFVNEFEELGSTVPTYNEPKQDSFSSAEDDIPF